MLAIVWGKRLRMIQVLCNQGNNKSPNPEEDLVFVDICDFMLEKAVKGMLNLTLFLYFLIINIIPFILVKKNLNFLYY